MTSRLPASPRVTATSETPNDADQVARGGEFVARGGAEHAGDLGALVVVELDERGGFERAREHVGREEGVAQVHVEEADGARARVPEEARDGLARTRLALAHRAEADRVGARRKPAPLGSPFQIIPRGVRVDGEVRFAVRVDLHADGAGRVRGVALDERGLKPDAGEACDGLAPERVVADAAGDDGAVAEQARDVGEVRRRPAQLPARGQHVPDQLAEADDGE